MEYTIVIKDFMLALKHEVNYMIKDWRLPQWGISMAASERYEWGTLFAQAMIKSD